MILIFCFLSAHLTFCFDDRQAELISFLNRYFCASFHIAFQEGMTNFGGSVGKDFVSGTC